MITQEELIEFANYNKHTGVFTRKHDSSNGRWKSGTRIGTVQYSKKDSDYRRILIRLNGKSYYGHQLAFLYLHGYIPSEIAHFDGNPLNNSIENLSDVSHSSNMKNIKGNRNNKSGFLGIRIANDRSKKYRVSIGKSGFIKSFYTMEEAVAYRNKLEKENNYHENHGIQLNKEL